MKFDICPANRGKKNYWYKNINTPERKESIAGNQIKRAASFLRKKENTTRF
jgi:hypothetical protein